MAFSPGVVRRLPSTCFCGRPATRGTFCGRHVEKKPVVVTDRHVALARARLAAGASLSEAARAVSVSRTELDIALFAKLGERL